MTGGLAVVGAVTAIIQPISSPIEQLLVANALDWFWILLSIAYGIGTYIAGVMLLSKTLLPHWLPTYGRVRYLLATEISTDEAQKVSFLFDGSLGGIWYPLWSLRKIDKAFRKEALFRLANRIASNHGLHRPFVMPEDFVGQEAQTETKKNPQQKSETHRTDHLTSSSLRVLGLQSMPTDFATIRQTYRRKVAQFHPDKFANESKEVIRYSEETTKALNAAYAHLENVYKKTTS
jgi:DnaJ-domain-containing protein 1